MSVLAILSLTVQAVIVIYVVKYIFDYFMRRKFYNQFAGPRDLPLIGNVHQLPSNPSELRKRIRDWCEEFRKEGHSSGRVWVGTVPHVVIFGAKDVEKVLQSTVHITKNDIYDYLIDWLGYGLLTSTGSKWKSRRRLLTPSFHFDILNDFMNIFNEQARIFVKNVGSPSGKLDDIFNLVTRCTLDIICETAMGIKMETQSLKNAAYIDAVHKISSVAILRMRLPWVLSNLLFPLFPVFRENSVALKLVKDFTRQVIETRREELADQGTEVSEKKRQALLTTLLRAEIEDNSIDDDGIQEEVDTFMFEGHDTTSSGIFWAIQLIGRHPEVQSKLHEEIDEVFGESDRDVSDVDLKRLTYLDRVVKEVLRICPPVPYIGRELSGDLVMSNGLKLTTGAHVIISIYSLHRDLTIFPNPEKFDPERFSPENKEGRHPYAYVPFSAGPRNCIGQKFAQMEEKVILTWMLRRFSWECGSSHEDLAPNTEVVLRPSTKLDIKITQRH